MRIAFALVVLLLAGPATRAEALTIRDVIELTKAGISDEVLLALIDVDGGVYANDAATLKRLKEAGVSERVMVALVRSGRERRLPEPPPPAASRRGGRPTSGRRDRASRAPPTRGSASCRPGARVCAGVPGPPAIGTATRFITRVRSRARTCHSSPASQRCARSRRELPPTYWGFGGKLRPDAWGQRPADEAKPSDPPARDGKQRDHDGKPGRK